MPTKFELVFCYMTDEEKYEIAKALLDAAYAISDKMNVPPPSLSVKN